MPAPTEKAGRTLLGGALLLMVAIVGFALGGLCVYFYPRNSDAPSPTETEQASTSSGSRPVVARGRLEPADGVISVGVPTPDRISELKVKEGDTVKQGAPLVILFGEAMRELEVQSAKAQLNQATKRLAAIKKNGDAQIQVEEVRLKQITELEPFERKALQSKIRLLKAQTANAEQNSRRYVAAGDSLAKQEIEKQNLALQQIQTELRDARSQLAKLKTSTDLNRSMAKSQLEAAKAEVEQSQSAISVASLNTQLQQAEKRLQEARILAPSTGKILRLFAHPGELVSGRILEMADTDKMIALAEVYESDIARVELHQKATVTSDIGHIFEKGKNELEGEVIEIAGIIGKARVAPLDPLTAADRRVVEVKIALKPEGNQAKQIANLVGHQVLVTIATGSK